MKTKYKHIHFEKINQGEWNCYNKYHTLLGTVKTYGRIPAFIPARGTSYTIESLANITADIIDFMKQLQAP